MSKYTTQVRFICESVSGLSESAGLMGVNDVIQNAIPHVFDFDFPIYDESYRNVLCTKILKHYYTREIGAETVGLWKLWLDTRLNEIMPYYNQLYKTTALEFNPLYDVDLTTSYQKSGSDEKTGSIERSGNESVDKSYEGSESGNYSDNKDRTISENESKEYSREDSRVVDEDRVKSSEENGTSSNSSEESRSNTSNGTAWDLFSDTPQGGLTGVDSGEYLTTAKKGTSENSGSDSMNASGSGSSQVNTSSNENNDITDTLSVDANESIDKSGSVKDVNSGTKNIDNSGTESVGVERAESETENSKLTTTEDFMQRISGKTGGVSYSKRVLEFRQTFINIDMMIIKDLSDLFINLW